MNKFLTAAVALAIGAASTASFADTGNFFVNGNLGTSDYRISNAFGGLNASGANHTSVDKKDLAGAVRIGYRWNSVVDYGVETGYVNLGNAESRIANDSSHGSLKQKSRGWLLGGNLNYNINDSWYVSARGGWYRAHNAFQVRSYTPIGNFRGSSSTTGTGEYFGVGVGYNINKAFSVGVNYDNYHSNGNSSDVNKLSTNVAMYSVFGEYRFNF
ncbi:outer membrane protein [Dyella silvatica]|uniref:outer membrane protein n=1 Tax=Dyella silvatica TaxID=2992128 RepID=UPI00225AC6C5|nr:outer membrane beta-barrel protein [Dyella silvatica]